MKKERIHRSGGNVFADLRILTRAIPGESRIGREILKIVERRGLTQAAAGKLLGSINPRCPRC